MRLFILFHLNLCFSSIEESERKNVIKRCYWPLLELIEKLKIPVGLEATGYSLEEIKKIDPEFIKKLRFLIKNKYCEFIGSGYSQLIGPLIPSKVNQNNLKIGNGLYSKLLNIKPRSALINEQAFSTGILDNYLKNDYKTIIMDWDNCFKSNKKIKDKYFFFPQKILTANKKKINIIWSSSIFFQKFQRYVHGEIEINEYLKFIKSKKQKFKEYNVCIYASDLEAINYRPKRFKTESKINTDEWSRIEVLLSKLIDNDYKFIQPSNVIKTQKNKYSHNTLEFANPSFPCITKKQSKYNILRWATTGRNDNKINSTCWNIFNHFEKNKIKDSKYWQELCYLWSSDIRTHITLKRWKKYTKRTNSFLKKINLKILPSVFKPLKKKSKNIFVKNDKDKITIRGKNIELILNTKKGCSIEKFYNYKVSKDFLFGFVPHGYYEDISYGVDFYSGHLVIEPLGEHKITDLNKTNFKVENYSNGIIVNCKFNNRLGTIYKKIIFDDKNDKIGIKYEIKLKKNVNGSIRLNHITLNPKIFKNSLYYETNNGGNKTEKFSVGKINFDHGQSVSHLISANQAIGVTENVAYLGDKSKNICINIDRNSDTQVGMVSFKKIKNKNFFRLYFSVKEHDDTTKLNNFFKAETLTWISSGQRK